MQKSLFKKGFVLEIIILFIGASVVPVISLNAKENNLNISKKKIE